MPINDEQSAKFKVEALKQGYDERAVDMFVDKKKNEPEPIEPTNFDWSQYQNPQQQSASQLPINLGQDTFTEPMVSGASAQTQRGIIPMKAQITQPFGNRSSIERYSGGTNLGTDFAVPSGTPMAVPPGNWVVVEAYGGAREGDRSANNGSGNMVKIQNTQTGETLGFEHLSRIGVRPGQPVSEGSVIALSGNTGNSTGPHASIPYQTPNGQYADVLKSPYGRYLYAN